MAALETAGAGAQARDGERRCVVDEEGQPFHRLAGADDPDEIRIPHLAAPELVGRNLGLLGEDPRRELLGRHFEREERDLCTVGGRPGLGAGAESGCGTEGDVGCERRLPHAGAARQDDQVGGVQPTQQAVEIDEAGRRAGEPAVALIGLLDHLDGAGQRRGELLPAGIDAAFFGKLVEAVLSRFDLLRRRLVERPVVGVVHHFLADADEGAAQRQVVDRPSVMLGVDHRHGGAGEAGQILTAAGLLQRLVSLEIMLESHGIGDLPALDHAEHGVVDAAVHRQEEMFRQQEGADQACGFVVDQQRAEQRLLGFEVARWGAVARRLGCRFL